MSKVSLDSRTERDLIRKIQHGDKEAFGQIYNHYQTHIKSYFRQRGLEETTASDLSSTVFERAFKGIDNFRWQGLSLSSWLYKIARNVLIDFFRESAKPNRRTANLELIEHLPSHGETPEEAALRNETSFFLSQLLKRLPERETRIIYLKFFEGYGNSEIATILKLSETNVGTIVSRVIDKLRKEVLTSSPRRS